MSLFVCLCRAIGLFAASYLDGTLYLPGDDVGLLEHSGMLSILIGDVLLFGLCANAARATCRIGIKLPSKRPAVVRRYVRTQLNYRAYAGPNHFLRLFFGFALVGLLALSAQSVKLFDPSLYYGHDTFDSLSHIRSFVANRINLFISWCVVLPLFFTYLVIHIAALQRLVKVGEKHHLLSFNVHHPDRSGGFSYFGCLNTIYVFGLTIVLLETCLLVYTHDRLGLANAMAVGAAGAATVAISYYSIWGLQRAIRRIELQMKSKPSFKRASEKRDLDTHFFAVIYQINFSAYSYLASKAILALRVVALVPAAVKIWQYSLQSP